MVVNKMFTRKQAEFILLFEKWTNRKLKDKILDVENPTPEQIDEGILTFYESLEQIIECICNYDESLMDDETEATGDFILDIFEELMDKCILAIAYKNYIYRDEYNVIRQDMRDQLDQLYSNLLITVDR